MTGIDVCPGPPRPDAPPMGVMRIPQPSVDACMCPYGPSYGRPVLLFVTFVCW